MTRWQVKEKELWQRPLLFWALLIVVTLVACTPAESVTPTLQPTAVLPLTPPPTPPLATAVAPTNASPPAQETVSWRVGAVPGVPPDLHTHAQTVAATQPKFAWTDAADQADVLLTPNDGRPLAQWIYAAAAPFPTVTDAVTTAELTAAWQTGDLLLTVDVAAALSSLWGAATEQATALPSTTLIDTLWAQRPSRTILPFHRLAPRLKVLAVDGRSPLDPALDIAAYPLRLDVGVTGDETAVAAFLAAWDGPTTNRDLAKMTRVAMTGVTALTRATAYQMEIQGITAPGTAVAPILTTADIAHISHEVAFATDCPYPNPVGGTTFCARDGYLELLMTIGTDVVELTGNHVNDWGTNALLRTLQLYADAGMTTFGGGRDLAHATAPATFTHNGNRIAFVGCNPVGPAFAWATETRPGSRPCDASFADQIATLHADGYLVIATQQYNEFYHYAPTAQQQTDFRALADAGAAAVSGSQGHHAQGFGFHNGAFIHYGLGNLFFDQMDQLGTRQTFIDTYVIYDGRLLTVELWTGLIENWCCPREMTAQERAQALTAVFQASDW